LSFYKTSPGNAQ